MSRDQPQNTTSYVHPRDPNLNRIENAMTYDPAGEPHLRVFLGTDTLTISGDVNLIDSVRINNTDQQSIPVHLTDDSIAVTQSTDPWIISRNSTANATNNRIYVSTDGTVELGSTTLAALENTTVTISGTPTVSLSADSLSALENINATVSGTVALDSASLTALETINATVSGTVELGSTTLAALETITVGGTVELGSTTLSALENVGVTGTVTVQDGGGSITVDGSVSATVSGTVELGATTLSALETITVGGTVELGSTTLSALENTTVTVTGSVLVDNDSTNPLEVNAQITNVDPIDVKITGPITVTQTAGDPTLVKYINTPNNLQMDMTQRLRVATPSQTWWYAPTIDKDGDLRYIESATGTNSGSIFVQNLSSINMSPGTDANGSFIRISRRRHKLRPGVSMVATFSINWNGYVPDGNVTKRVGMFTNYNGVFFEMTGDLQAVIRRRLTDGTVVEKRIARADFNIDKLDGTGASGYDLRPVVINTSTITAYVSKTPVSITGDGTVYQVVFTVGTPGQFYVGQKGRITGVSPTLYNGTVMVTAINGSNVTFVYNVDPGSFTSLSSAKFDHTNLHNQYVWGFDFNGNRATSIRFFIDGPLGRMAIHQENFGGALGTPFANAPAISTRYEIFNTGAPGRLPNFTSSSEVVNVEAELELNPGFGVASNNTPVVYSKNGTATYPVLGIALRVGEPYQRADLQPQSVTFADIANINQQNSGVFYWRLVLNPTIGGTVPASTNIGKATRMWAYTASTTVSGGIDLLSGYASSTQQFDVRTALNFINLGSNIAYDDSDKIVLVVKQLVGGTSDAQLVATINFIEAL